MIRENRFWVALGLFVGIGLLEWFTLDGQVRLVAMALLGLFAVRTVIYEKRRELQEKIDSERSRD